MKRDFEISRGSLRSARIPLKVIATDLALFPGANSYSAPLYIDMKKRVLVQDSEEPDPETGELNWVEEHEDDEGTGEEEKIYIGKVRS